MSAAAGAELARERSARGLSIDQVAAATRVRRNHLEALESGDLELLPGPVYTRGYLRTYATYLGIDPEPLLAAVKVTPVRAPSSLSIGRLAPVIPAGLALTGPLLAGIGLAILVLLFGLYGWRQFDSLRSAPAPVLTPVVAAPIAVLPSSDPNPALTAAAVAPAVPPARVVLVMIRVTEQAWLSVDADGKPVFGASGRFFDAGQSALFAGRSITITSGKGASTLVMVDGRDLGPLGPGVTSREFKADN